MARPSYLARRGDGGYLEAMGTILDARLHAYVDRGPPANERLLAERCAFEHEVRGFLTRAQDRGYAYPQRFPRMPTTWVDFANQNKAAENEIARLNVRRAYESGRHEVVEAVTEGWTAPKTPPGPQPLDRDDRLVQDAVAQKASAAPRTASGLDHARRRARGTCPHRGASPKQRVPDVGGAGRVPQAVGPQAQAHGEGPW